jgi:hypothetical protein
MALSRWPLADLRLVGGWYPAYFSNLTVTTP